MKPNVPSLALILLALSLSAQAEPLKVKPGLWETTTTTEMKGASRPANLDKLTPEQRAKVEKKLAERVRKETRTVQACLSEAQIKSGDTFLGKSHQASCARTFETQTDGDLVASINCAGANAMTGRVEMHAADPEHMGGRVDMIYGAAGRLQLATRSDVASRWLGSDCGKVVASNPHRR